MRKELWERRCGGDTRSNLGLAYLDLDDLDGCGDAMEKQRSGLALYCLISRQSAGSWAVRYQGKMRLPAARKGRSEMVEVDMWLGRKLLKPADSPLRKRQALPHRQVWDEQSVDGIKRGGENEAGGGDSPIVSWAAGSSRGSLRWCIYECVYPKEVLSESAGDSGAARKGGTATVATTRFLFSRPPPWKMWSASSRLAAAMWWLHSSGNPHGIYRCTDRCAALLSKNDE
jgi:hypothetical protein